MADVLQQTASSDAALKLSSGLKLTSRLLTDGAANGPGLPLAEMARGKNVKGIIKKPFVRAAYQGPDDW